MDSDGRMSPRCCIAVALTFAVASWAIVIVAAMLVLNLVR
jgi:hypothetical protein